MKPRQLGKAYQKRRRPKTIHWDYVPTERQKAFHKSKERFKLYGGAMGGGKSYCLCAEAIRLSAYYQGNRGYFCRNHVVDFKRATLVTFGKVCPPAIIKNHYRDDRIIEFTNGSEILYGGLGSEEDLERIKSTEFGWFAIDEASEAQEDYFLMLMSRLRWKLKDGSAPPYHGILASNPEPGWVKERFVDEKLKDHIFVPALPKDNPHLETDYYSSLVENYPEEWVKRYIDGSWDVFEGQIYTEFDRKVHVYKDMEIGKHWPRIRIIDHGYTNPTCCLWAAIDYDGKIWIYDEHYERQKTIDEHAYIIHQKHPDFNGTTLIDPSCFNNTMQKNGKPCSPSDEYRSEGIQVISPYSKDGFIQEGVGINLVKQRLKKGELFIHESCVNTIKEMINYRWRDLRATQKGDKNAPEEPVDKDNHAMDCVRYLCCWKPSGSRIPKPPLPPNSVHAIIMKHRKQAEQQTFAGW